jgi:putative transcriptional regulator
MEINYGNLSLQIEYLLKTKGISKNQACKDLDIPRSNFNRYCRNEYQRLDAHLICKLCWYLNVDISELVVYNRPSN